jgi:hypothetical protein
MHKLRAGARFAALHQLNAQNRPCNYALHFSFRRRKRVVAELIFMMRNFSPPKKSWLRAKAIFAKQKPTDVKTVSHDHRSLRHERNVYEDGPGSDDE